jgi:ectoine hydroxylase-related dioxygenase (phytanoyl-CoA dioxygenase family)
MTDSVTQRHLDEIAEQGYTIVADAIETRLVDRLNQALLDIERRCNIVPGDNSFEGHRTIRIYNLLARADVFAEVPVHPRVLPIIEGVLDEGCLVSSLSSISIDPGEGAQPLHADDTLLGIARPHAPLVCNSMWALTDFTEANGATRVVPGSHRYPEKPVYGAEHPSIPAEMKRGSVLIWNGSLWHGGGANRSAARRVGIAMNYCAGFIRQQENQQLGIPLARVKRFPPRLQQLVGYGTYKNLIGHIDKASPSQRLLGVDDAFRSVWDVIK